MPISRPVSGEDAPRSHRPGCDMRTPRRGAIARMHRQKVSLAINVARPWDWYGVWAATQDGEREAKRQGIEQVTWRVLEPESPWIMHLSEHARVGHHIKNPVTAIYGEGWAWKE